MVGMLIDPPAGIRKTRGIGALFPADDEHRLNTSRYMLGFPLPVYGVLAYRIETNELGKIFFCYFGQNFFKT